MESLNYASKIDLRSDTVSIPTLEMRLSMMHARVGDDAYGEDVETKALEDTCAKLFGKEEALFLPSGTMSNQIAVRTHTCPGDEIITDVSYHVYYYESAPTSSLAGINFNLIETSDGLIKVKDIESAIARKPRGQLYSPAKLVCLENPVAAHSGKIVPLGLLEDIYEYCNNSGLRVHLDGARIFHAASVTNTPLHEYGKTADTINLCFSKALSAPFGSVLIGSSSDISTAKKYRKWYGGALHQSGFMAAAAAIALKRGLINARACNLLATRFADALRASEYFEVLPVDTNIVLFRLVSDGGSFVEDAEKQGLLLLTWTMGWTRAVTHPGITESEIGRATSILIAAAENRLLKFPSNISKERHLFVARS